MSTTDEIKARIDIVDYINNYVQLKKTGRNYKGLCPFHNEKTPSFTVFQETGTWRCFGCQRGGDIFNFVMEIEGWDFRESLHTLADVAGVQLEPLTPTQVEAQEQEERLLDLLAATTRYYVEQLRDSPQAEHARHYIEGRSLTWETIEQFEIGFAPNSWQATYDHLLGLGYQQADLIEAGLLVVRDNGNTYDRFRNRIVIPIRDARGSVVGFGARTLEKNGKPKYLNSPQSRLFDKSSLLYGFSMARRSIREVEVAIIVEGYMDVIQAHQAGYTNVIAQMGTALTEDQLKLLARYASRLVLALDPDAAGQMATARGLEAIERVSEAAAAQAAEEGIWGFDGTEGRANRTVEFDAAGMVRYENNFGFDIRVAVLPQGQDPDDLIRHNAPAWEDIVERALPIVEYTIQKAIEGRDLDNPKEKSAIVDEVTPLINHIANQVERAHYRQKLARLLRVPESAFFSKAPDQRPRKRRSTRRPAPLPAPMPTAETLLTPTVWREAFCLAAFLQDHTLIYRVNRVLSQYFDLSDDIETDALNHAHEHLPHALARRVTVSDFAHPDHRAVFEVWEQALIQDEYAREDYLRHQLDGSIWTQVNQWLRRPLYQLHADLRLDEHRLNPDTVFEAVIQAVLELREKRLTELRQELVLLFQDMDNGGGVAALRDYMVTVNTIQLVQRKIIRARRDYSLQAKLNG